MSGLSVARSELRRAGVREEVLMEGKAIMVMQELVYEGRTMMKIW